MKRDRGRIEGMERKRDGGREMKVGREGKKEGGKYR